MSVDPCQGAEHLLQPYLDRALTQAEVTTVERHLAECSYCNDRYVFERRLRDQVRVCCCGEPVPAGLVDRLRVRCSGHSAA
jgi:mycothiol system anti-sigma-R factor